jgi:hypothetical protein
LFLAIPLFLAAIFCSFLVGRVSGRMNLQTMFCNQYVLGSLSYANAKKRNSLC